MLQSKFYYISVHRYRIPKRRLLVFLFCLYHSVELSALLARPSILFIPEVDTRQEIALSYSKAVYCFSLVTNGRKLTDHSNRPRIRNRIDKCWNKTSCRRLFRYMVKNYAFSKKYIENFREPVIHLLLKPIN